MAAVIELQEVSYTYPKATIPALQKVSLSIAQGKFVLVMGAAGAGKTTLSLCLNGLIPQLLEGNLAGSITVAGRNLSKYRVQTMSKHIGVVLQDPETQVFGMTVFEDTAFGPKNLALPVEEVCQRVEQALQSVRLTGYEQRSTAELSGGEKQRLAIAGVLAMQPEVLVLDEPTSQLDPTGRNEIYQTIEDLRAAEDLTMLVIEHYSEEITNRVDEVVVLDQGKVVWQGKPPELFPNLPLLDQLGIRPLPVSEVGWHFYQQGWLEFADIPLDVPSAEAMMRKLLAQTSVVPVQEAGQREAEVPTTDRSYPVILAVQNLVHQYNSTQIALNQLNLAIRQGEFVALVGQNGAGKTTLAKHFNGLLKPTSGDVVVAGLNTKNCQVTDLAQKVGYVFQNPDHQIFAASVEKEIEFGLKNAGIVGAEMQARIEQVLEFTGLTAHRQEHPFALSKGTRQMIAVASILALKPQILVIDEPTTGLDWAGVQKIMGLIQELHAAGTTIIMISHDMELVSQYAQRVVVMQEGNILLDGNPREVFANSALLQQAAVVPPQICRLAQRLADLGIDPTILSAQEFIQAFAQTEEDAHV